MIPEDLAATVAAHGAAVASADNKTVLADFMPDRLGQLIASADVPNRLKSAAVQSIANVGEGRYDATIRYARTDDSQFELRSRWVRFDDGTWRVLSVRNIPATPPWMNLTGPADDGSDAPHWAGLKAGELVLQRCNACRMWVWSPRPICPGCHSFEMGWASVEPTGIIYSWTRTWQAFTEESAGHLPYVVVLVELPGANGCRVLGFLENADDMTPRIGMPVRGRIEQPPDDDHWPLLRWQTLDAL